jgi:hypothetical protein
MDSAAGDVLYVSILLCCPPVLIRLSVCIRLHSAAAYPPHKSPIFSPSYSAAQSCFQETESIITLARYVVNAGLLPQLGPPFAFTLWVGARVLLVHGSTIEKQVSPTVHFLIDLLRQLGTLWPIAARYASILHKVMDDYQEGQTAAPTATGKGTGTNRSTHSSTVPILADMRRTAYDLDLLITSHHGGYGRGAGPVLGTLQQLPQRQHSQHSQSGQQQPTPSSATTPATLWPPSQTQPNSATGQARFPDSNELEYLEAFDFFNYPRLPGNAMPAAQGFEMAQPQQVQGEHFDMNVNIDQFSVDPGSDWLVGNFGKAGSATW